MTDVYNRGVAFVLSNGFGVNPMDGLPTFGAMVSGLAAGATIDLPWVAYNESFSLAFTANPDGGILTASDASNGAVIALLGTYSAEGFQAMPDGRGGTAVTYSG